MMKRSSVFVCIISFMLAGAGSVLALFLVILLFSCEEKKPHQVQGLAGHYLYQYKTNPLVWGWGFGERSEYHLFLNADSSYEEVHLTSSSFEAFDYWGYWQTRHDTIALQEQGEMEEENGKYVRGGYVHYEPVEYSGWRDLIVLDAYRLEDNRGKTVLIRQ